MKKKENTITSDALEPDVAAKPKRGRKPRAKKLDETPKAAAVPVISEDAENPEESGDTAPRTDIESEVLDAKAEPENTAEPVSDSTGTANVSNRRPISAEDVTESLADTADKTAPEPMAKEAPPDTVDTERRPDTENDGEKSDNTATGVPASDALPEARPAAQVIESPMKLLKQEFQARTQKIKEEMRNIQDSFLIIGFQLHWIRENNMFRVLNYKNIYEYAEKEFGVKKTTCCNFISIIENYAERDAAGNVIESIADCYKNYSSSQLVAMLGMPPEMQQQVTPDMSVRAINRLRKGEPEKPVIDAEPSSAGGKTEVEKAAPVPVEKPQAEPKDVTEVPSSDAKINMVQTSDPEHTLETEDAQKESADTFAVIDEKVESDTGESVDTAENNETIETLMELDNSNYQSELGKLDGLLKDIFSAHTSARIKIVYEQT